MQRLYRTVDYIDDDSDNDEFDVPSASRARAHWRIMAASPATVPATLEVPAADAPNRQMGDRKAYWHYFHVTVCATPSSSFSPSSSSSPSKSCPASGSAGGRMPLKATCTVASASTRAFMQRYRPASLSCSSSGCAMSRALWSCSRAVGCTSNSSTLSALRRSPSLPLPTPASCSTALARTFTC